MAEVAADLVVEAGRDAESAYLAPSVTEADGVKIIVVCVVEAVEAAVVDVTYQLFALAAAGVVVANYELEMIVGANVGSARFYSELKLQKSAMKIVLNESENQHYMGNSAQTLARYNLDLFMGNSASSEMPWNKEVQSSTNAGLDLDHPPLKLLIQSN
ncbi:hypothetical protein Ancab_004547 [Ancistrocladus abbreviatus]